MARPRPLMPSAAPASGSWFRENNSTTNIVAGVSKATGLRDDTTYIWTNDLDNPTPGPVVVILLDDTARQAMYGTLQNTGYLGPALSYRVGQLATQTIWDELVTGGTDFRCHIATWGPCWPTRAEVQTCLFRKNHHMRNNTGTNYQAVYVDPAGEYVQLTGRPAAETAGPWGRTLASTLPPQRVSVTDPSHAALLRVGRPDDDVQARTGSWIQELARAGVSMFGGGKWTNPWDHTFPIPAGFISWRGQEIDSGSQYTSTFVPYDGANAWDGAGVTVGTTETHNYSRGNATSCVWSAANGGRLLVQCTSHKFVDPATVDYVQQCTLVSGSPSALDGTYVVAAVTDANHFELTCTVDPGVSGTPAVYNRNEYPIFKIVNDFLTFAKAQKAAGKPVCGYIAPHLTHDTGLGTDGYGSSFEKCYAGGLTTPAGGGLWFDGVETQVCPTAHNPATAGEVDEWQANVLMMASINDAIKLLIDGLRAMHGENFTVILTSDQGQQNGDQSANGNGGVKTAIWQSSASPFCFARGPHFAKGAKQTRLSTHADIGLTILDIFGRAGLSGLLDNHMHEDRDGCSWIGNGTTRPSIFDPTHVAYNRIIPVYGDWKAVSGEGYLDQSLKKFVRAEGVTTACKTYDTRLPSEGGDYETAEGALSTLTTPTLATFNSRFGLIDDARWDQAANKNIAHDGSLVQ